MSSAPFCELHPAIAELSDEHKTKLNVAAHALYAEYAKRRAPAPAPAPAPATEAHHHAGPDQAERIKVGIVGGGIAGLYTALMLQNFNKEGLAGGNWDFHIYEANNRVGGRVYTHRFTQYPGRNQYFEAGAMRIPILPFQLPVFELISWLNQRAPHKDNHDPAVKLITYTLSENNSNFVYVNGKFMSVGEAAKEGADLGFGFPVPASEYLKELIGKDIKILVDALKESDQAFADAFWTMVKQKDRKSLQEAMMDAGWSKEKINYVEVMTTQTNQQLLSYVDNVMMNIDFGGTAQEWRTIKDGMDTLPNAMEYVLGRENITLNARVEVVKEVGGGKKVIVYRDANGNLQESGAYDKILFALPPAAMRMIQKPFFGPMKEAAIRSLNFEPLHKIGIQFDYKFWKMPNQGLPAVENGGQSVTDLPSRWIVYPSYGNDENPKTPGVLLLYAWNTDAQNFVHLTEAQRLDIAIRDLKTVYPKVDFGGDMIKDFKTVNWVEQWCMGDALFLPGQFQDLWVDGRSDQNGYYFAGEHLSHFHTWIAGAIHSSIHVLSQMTGQDESWVKKHVLNGNLRAQTQNESVPHPAAQAVHTDAASPHTVHTTVQVHEMEEAFLNKVRGALATHESNARSSDHAHAQTQHHTQAVQV